MLIPARNREFIFSFRLSVSSLFSGVNFNDVLCRYGLLEDIPRPPFVPGFECSGEVLDIGSNVTHIDVRKLELCIPFSLEP